MDGFTATEEIRKLEEHIRSEKPAVADTGSSSASGGDPPPLVLAGTPSSQGGRSRLHVPIVALTASATPDYQQKCYAHGMDDFLSKVHFLWPSPAVLLPLTILFLFAFLFAWSHGSR